MHFENFYTGKATVGLCVGWKYRWVSVYLKYSNLPMFLLVFHEMIFKIQRYDFNKYQKWNIHWYGGCFQINVSLIG